MQKILIRADARRESGLGHVVRSLALAEILAQEFQVDFIAEESLPDFIAREISQVCGALVRVAAVEGNAACLEAIGRIAAGYQAVVIDQYQNPEEMVAAVKVAGLRVIRIVDAPTSDSAADLVFGHSCQYPDTLSTKGRQCQGIEYAMVRKLFYRSTGVEEIATRSIDALLSFGGYDAGNVTLKVLRVLEARSELTHVAVVIGEAYPHRRELDLYLATQTHRTIQLYQGVSGADFAQLIENSRSAFMPASGTALEAAAVGVGLCVGMTAENQRWLHQQLTERGVAGDLGKIAEISDSELLARCSELLSAPQRITGLVQQQRLLLDGKAGQRIVELFREVVDG